MIGTPTAGQVHVGYITPMSIPSVSVVIPCYNGAAFLASTIESVLAQTHPRIDILVVDDGSSDNSKAVVERYPRVRYLRQANQGASVARNRGLAESQSDYIIFLDQDDRLLPHTVELGVQVLERHPECAMMFGLFREIGSDGSARFDQTGPTLVAGEQIGYEHFLANQIMLISPGQAMYRRTAVAAINGFNPSLWPSDDYDFQLRMVRQFPVYYCNEILFEYRRHDHSSSMQTGNYKILQLALKRLDDQLPYIAGHAVYEAAYRRGKKRWREFIEPILPQEMVVHLKRGELGQAFAIARYIIQHSPGELIRYIKTVIARRQYATH